MDPPPVGSIKRKMGSSDTVTLGDQSFSPEQVSAKILEACTQRMHAFLEASHNESLEHLNASNQAVITIPAYFDAPQIEATKRAGVAAGLEVIGLLQEPTAAAMYFAWKHGIEDGTFLVYDLGGGTFDVSVIRCIMGEYQVLGIDGDNYLGGDDLDRKLADDLRARLVEQGYALELNIADDPTDRTRFTLLTRLAQEVKEALSTQDVHHIGRRDLFEDQEGRQVSIDLEVTKSHFEDLIAPMIDQTIDACHRALKKAAAAADLDPRQLDHVLLVGGSTRVPLVQAKVTEAFCGPERSRAQAPSIDQPDTCVALGAAIHAANLAGLVLRPEDASSARVRIKSSLTTDAPKLRIAGAVEAPELSVQIDSLVLLSSVGEIAGIARPRSDTRTPDGFAFAFDEVAVATQGLGRLELELCDDEGDALVSLELPVERLAPGQRVRSTGSALSNPSVLAKDLYLEVVAQEGELSRQVLLPSGTSLPAEGSFRFYTADDSGAVILRLFQNRFPVRTIHLATPPQTPPGTPVDLNLSIDEAMTMIASGEVHGQSFWAQIEPPPERETRGWSHIEALLERRDQVERELWGHESGYFREETLKLAAGIREAARTDPDKLQVLASRLEEFLEYYQTQDRTMTPSFARFSDLLDAIKRVVYRGDDGQKLGLSSEQWTQRLSQVEAQGRTAFEAHDREAWRTSFNQVQAIWESLAQEEYRYVQSDPREYVLRIHARLDTRIQDLRRDLEDFALSQNPETQALQSQKLGELRDDAAQKLAAPFGAIDPQNMPVAQARQELERLQDLLGHLERQLEKLPTLGLVRT